MEIDEDLELIPIDFEGFGALEVSLEELHGEKGGMERYAVRKLSVRRREKTEYWPSLKKIIETATQLDERSIRGLQFC